MFGYCSACKWPCKNLTGELYDGLQIDSSLYIQLRLAGNLKNKYAINFLIVRSFCYLHYCSNPTEFVQMFEVRVIIGANKYTPEKCIHYSYNKCIYTYNIYSSCTKLTDRGEQKQFNVSLSNHQSTDWNVFKTKTQGIWNSPYSIYSNYL